MHYRISGIQKARIIIALGILISGIHSLSAQINVFSTGYMKAGIYAGKDSDERQNEESAILLFDRRVIEYKFEDNSLVQYEIFHRKYQVFDEKAVEEISKLYLPMNDAEEIIFVQGKSVSPLGFVTETNQSKIKSVEEENEKYKLLVIEGVQEKGTVEYMYGLRKRPNIYPMSYLGGNTRVLESEFWIMAPENLSIDFQTYNTNKFKQIDSSYTYIDKSKAKLTIFKIQDIDPIINVGKNFAINAIKYRVACSIRRNLGNTSGLNYEYNDFIRITNDGLVKEKAAGTKEIKKLAASLNLDKNLTEKAKIIEIETYIKNNFAKISSNNPDVNSIKFLLKNKQGSDEAIVALYSGLFDYFNIKHTIGFSIEKDLRFIDSDFETWANIDEWIFHFPNADIYTQPLDPGSAPGYLDHDFRGNKMIAMKGLQVGEIKSAVAELQDIKHTVTTLSKETIKVNFNDEFEPSTKFDYYFRGYTGALLKWLRDATFEDPGFFQSVINGFVEGRYNELKTKNITFKFDSEYGDKEFGTSILFSAFPEDLTAKAGDNLILYAGRYFKHSYSKSNLPDNYPYRVIAAEDQDNITEFEITIPEGYSVEIPETAKIDTKVELGKNRFVSLKTSFKTENNKLTISIEEKQHIGILEVGEAKLLNPFWAELEKAEKIAVVFSKNK